MEKYSTKLTVKNYMVLSFDYNVYYKYYENVDVGNA